jgi:hypothetical protein
VGWLAFVLFGSSEEQEWAKRKEGVVVTADVATVENSSGGTNHERGSGENGEHNRSFGRESSEDKEVKSV